MGSLGHRTPGAGQDTYSQGFNDSYKPKGKLVKESKYAFSEMFKRIGRR